MLVYPGNFIVSARRSLPSPPSSQQSTPSPLLLLLLYIVRLFCSSSLSIGGRKRRRRVCPFPPHWNGKGRKGGKEKSGAKTTAWLGEGRKWRPSYVVVVVVGTGRKDEMTAPRGCCYGSSPPSSTWPQGREQFALMARFGSFSARARVVASGASDQFSRKWHSEVWKKSEKEGQGRMKKRRSSLGFSGGCDKLIIERCLLRYFPSQACVNK